MLILSAIHHFVRTALFTAYMPLAEAQLSKCLDIATVNDEDGNSQGHVV